MPRQTRQLNSPLHRLSSAVRKEDAIQARQLAEAFRQQSLIFVVIEIRKMNDAARLLPNRLHDTRMSMSQRVHSQPGHKVEILLAFEVVEKDSFAALEGNGIAIVGIKKKTLFKIGNLFQAGHGLIVDGLIVERTDSRGRLAEREGARGGAAT